MLMLSPRDPVCLRAVPTVDEWGNGHAEALASAPIFEPLENRVRADEGHSQDSSTEIECCSFKVPHTLGEAMTHGHHPA